MSTALLIMCKDEFIKVKNIIKSCESVIDEVVVVVTGDKKVKESGNYKVLYYPWHDCYSSPLNAGLRLIESDWIFRMDADEEIDLKNIEISNNAHGKPSILLKGKIANYLKKKIKSKKYYIHLSLSDDKPWAQATVIISYNK